MLPLSGGKLVGAHNYYRRHDLPFWRRNWRNGYVTSGDTVMLHVRGIAKFTIISRRGR